MIWHLHSLIVLVGGTQSGKSAWAKTHFPEHEILRMHTITQEMCGRPDNHVHKHDVWQELLRRTHIRLNWGQTVVVDHTNLHKLDRQQFADLAVRYGARLQFVIFDAPEPGSDAHVHFQHKEAAAYHQCVRDLTTKWQEHVVYAHDVVTNQRETPRRILAVGDVHGDHVSMKLAVNHAQANDLHVIWLGDVLDYGDQNLKCVHLAYETVRSHRAHMIWGNHERKISRWLDADWGKNYTGRLSEASWKTIREIDSLNYERKQRFLSAWRCLESASTQVITLNNWLFTHGAAHPDAWNTQQHRLTGQAGEWAFFGEVLSPTDRTAQGYPIRSWSWVNQVPENHYVVVGHDWVDRANMQVIMKTGAQGGHVLCVDTGNSKGGHLSAVEIDLNTNKWEARVFKP